MIMNSVQQNRPELNSLELKLCFGQDILDGICNHKGHELGPNRGSKVGKHVDRNIGLDGNSDSDSVSRDAPILTLTLGSDWVMSFQSCLTKNGRNWDKSSKGKVKFDLTDNSLFFCFHKTRLLFQLELMIVCSTSMKWKKKAQVCLRQ